MSVAKAALVGVDRDMGLSVWLFIPIFLFVFLYSYIYFPWTIKYFLSILGARKEKGDDSGV